MNSSRHKRSSILKKRPSVDPSSLEGSPSEMITTTKVIKRIGFKPKKSVKEFFSSEETATIWCNSYELSADNTPPGLLVTDSSAVKDDSKALTNSTNNDDRQEDKENRLSLEERRTSLGDNSSFWNLSISASEEERRRLKAENSINSSVLNTTDKLTQDPLPLSKTILCQKQLEVCEDSNAMDISPIKHVGKLSSPKKILYHHPKQNMFVTIDVPEEKPSVQSPNDSEINFFGPQKNQTAIKDSEQAKVLFQTSNANNQWRNKSIQTEPRPSMVDGKRSIAVNADLSAGWSSHIAASEPFVQRLTYGNSNFEISEAWNSHPAAALRLKMLQQGMVSLEFDPRISDGGGGEDIDTTLAITQTVTKMLERGSKASSLDSTRIAESEPMEVTGNVPNHIVEQMDTSVNMEEMVEDETVTDVHLPTNALSKARPSFVPSAIPMDDSDCPSPEEKIVSVSGCQRKPKQRATVLESIPIETTQTERDASFLAPGPSHEPSPTNRNAKAHRRTNILEERIVEDSAYLAEPRVEVETLPKANMRQTVFDTKMDQSPAEQLPAKCSKTPMFMVEPIKLDFPELIFGDHSIGLGLTMKDEPMPHELNRPKIHRMPPRNLKLEFGALMPKDGLQKKGEHKVPTSTIVIDSPDPKSQVSNRKTDHAIGDLSLDKELMNKSAESEKMPRRTNFQNLDVSVDSSPVGADIGTKRVTVYANENLNESECLQLKESTKPRATILNEEFMERTCSDLRPESVEKLKNRSQTRKTIRHNDTVECESPETGIVIQSKNRSQEPRRTDVNKHNISVENVEDNVKGGKDAKEGLQKSLRATIFYNDQLDQTRLETLSGGSSENLATSNHARKTMQRNEAMECESPKVEIAIKPTDSRRTQFPSSDMDQSINHLSTNFDSESRRTIANKFDVSVEIVDDDDRDAIFSKNSYRKPLRTTVFYNEQMEQTRLETHSGSLENFGTSDHARRKTIQQNEAMECESPKSEILMQLSDARRTQFPSNDMDQSIDRLSKNLDPESRRIYVNKADVSVEIVDNNEQDVTLSNNAYQKPIRSTVFYNEKMEQTRLETRSGSSDNLKTSDHERKTIQPNEAMKCESPKLGIVMQHSNTRKTKLPLSAMDQSVEHLPKNFDPESRRTNVNEHDISVEIVDDKEQEARHFDNGYQKSLRSTVYYNDQMEQTRLEARFGSLENLRKSDYAQKSIQRNKEMECELLEPKKTIKHFGRDSQSTAKDYDELDVSVQIVEDIDRDAFLANEIYRRLPRTTMLCNDQLEQTRLEPRSGSLENLRMLGHERMTIQQNAAMNCVSPAKDSIVQSSSSRRTKYSPSEMDQSKNQMSDHYQGARKMPDIICNDFAVLSKDIPTKPTRTTILCNEQLELTSLGPRTGSLEDLRTSDQTRKIIQQNEAMEWVSPEHRKVMQPNSSRKTKYLLDDMDQTQSCPPVLVSKPRLTTGATNKSPISETVVTLKNTVALDSPVNTNQETNKHSDVPKRSRATIICDENLEETRLAPRSGSLEDLRKSQSRRTIDRKYGVLPRAGSPIQPSEVCTSIYQLGNIEDIPKYEPDTCLEPRVNNTITQDVDQAIHRSPELGVLLEGKKGRATIHIKTDMDESSCSRQSGILEKPKPKSRETIVARESMEQTLVDRQQLEMSQAQQCKVPITTKQKSRQTIIGRESMEETFVGRPLEVSQAQAVQQILQQSTTNSTDHKSRQTIIGRQSMDETLVDRRVERQLEPNLQEVRSESPLLKNPEHPGVSDIVSQKTRFSDSCHETTMDETNVFQNKNTYVSPRLDKCSSGLERNTAVKELGQDQDRNTANKTSQMIHIDETIRQSPNITEDVLPNRTDKSRFTSYATEKMDETISPASKLESIVLERSKMCTEMANPSMQKSRQTVYQDAPMDETRYVTPPENVTLPPRGSIIQSLSKARLTVNVEQFVDETIPIAEYTKYNNIPVQEIPSARQTIYERNPMEETVLALQNISVTNHERISRLSPSMRSSDTINFRQTIHKQQDMDETAVGNRVTGGIIAEQGDGRTFYSEPNVEPSGEETVGVNDVAREDNESVYNESTVPIGCLSPVEMCKNGIIPTATNIMKPNDYMSEMNQPNRQTILVAEDMDQTFNTPTSIVNASHNNYQSSRRTIIRPDQIVEECSRYPVIKEEPLESTRLVTSPTLEVQGQTKQEFSFAIPQLPDDCVLRSTASIPYYKTNPTMQNTPQLPQPVFGNCSITEPNVSERKTIAVNNLSEISGLDLSNCHVVRPVSGIQGPPGDMCNLTLKEVTEPTITPLVSVPVSVIQETPKKASMIPVRKSRGSIFDRQSMDLDESGIAPIASQEAPEQDDYSRDLLESAMTKLPVPFPPAQFEDSIVVKNEPFVESSDDEFYDAQLDQENEQPDCQDYVHVTKEAVQRNNYTERGNLKFVEVNDAEHCQSMIANQTSAGCRTVKFIDVDDLEQTAQKRHLSRISKSVLLDHDPLNVSLTEDYPTKKRKTKIPTPLKRNQDTLLVNAEPDQKPIRRVTFHDKLVLNMDTNEKDKCSTDELTNINEVETVTIKNECITIRDDEAEYTKLGQTILTDPSVFIIDESDMLANESNISFVGSSVSEHHNRGSSLKFDNTYYQDYVNLTLHVDQTANNTCIVISDDSLTAPSYIEALKTNSQILERRLTMEDLPERIQRTRESLVMNSTVASEVMYELRQQINEAKNACCSLQGNCLCGKRKTKVHVERENLETIREAWNQNFDRILSSVSELPMHSIPLDDRISEVLSRPMKPLPLTYLEQLQFNLPETPSVRFLCENYLKCQQDSISLGAEQNPCDLPATPAVTALIFNKLQTERFRWFLDTTDEYRMFLSLRHRTLRSIRFNIQLQKRQYSKQEDIRIVRLELTETRSDLVDSPRLQIAHLEVMRALNKSTVDLLCSQYPTTAHFMGFVLHVDTIVEQIFGKVDQLYRIVRNNGAIFKSDGHDRPLQIDKFFEYHHEGNIHWNRIYVRFDVIDQINHHSVIFHRKMINAECLLPTEQQCGKNGVHGLTFLECLLWNVEKISIV